MKALRLVILLCLLLASSREALADTYIVFSPDPDSIILEILWEIHDSVMIVDDIITNIRYRNSSIDEDVLLFQSKLFADKVDFLINQTEFKISLSGLTRSIEIYKLQLKKVNSPISTQAYRSYSYVRQDLLVHLYEASRMIERDLNSKVIRQKFDAVDTTFDTVRWSIDTLRLMADSLIKLVYKPASSILSIGSLVDLHSPIRRAALHNGILQRLHKENPWFAGLNSFVSIRDSKYFPGVGLQLGFAVGKKKGQLPRRFLILLGGAAFFEQTVYYDGHVGAAYFPDRSRLGYLVTLHGRQLHLGTGFMFRL